MQVTPEDQKYSGDDVVLVDEPTANLDHTSAFIVIELMRQMQKDLKTTFIFSTHDPKIVKEAEIIYTLEDGKLVSREDVSNLKDQVREKN